MSQASLFAETPSTSSTYENVITEFEISALRRLVIDEGLTTEAVSARLHETVTNALCEAATPEDYDDDEELESALHYVYGDAEVVNDAGFLEQIRCLYDCSDFETVKDWVLEAIGNLKSGEMKS
jgi:hypothetical protein